MLQMIKSEKIPFVFPHNQRYSTKNVLSGSIKSVFLNP